LPNLAIDIIEQSEVRRNVGFIGVFSTDSGC
jgi:hypothetical protein